MLHEWPQTAEQALAVQRSLRERVAATDELPHRISHLAGVDVAYSRDDTTVFAGVVVLDALTLRPVETRTAVRAVAFAYLPGLFAFRELPALLQALSEIETPIDLVVCDGHGLAHPRRLGLASHLGVLLDRPSIGVAKRRLIGAHREPGNARGSVANLTDDGEVIGAALRTQSNVKPVYVSVGHRISLATAVAWTLRLSTRYRLPESTRQADRMVNALRRAWPARQTPLGDEAAAG